MKSLKSVVSSVRRFLRKISSIAQGLSLGCKHFWQWLVRGFSDQELYSLDYSIAIFVLPRIKEFRLRCSKSYPSCVTKEEWQEILLKIEKSFYLIVHRQDYLFIEEDMQKNIDEGLKLFSEYYLNLWY